MNDAVFIYKKDKEVTVLDIEKSKLQHDELIKLGFKHISTLKASAWLNIVLNLEISDVEYEIYELLNN